MYILYYNLNASRGDARAEACLAHLGLTLVVGVGNGVNNIV